MSLARAAARPRSQGDSALNLNNHNVSQNESQKDTKEEIRPTALVFGSKGAKRIVTFDDLLVICRTRLIPYFPKRSGCNQNGNSYERSLRERVHIALTRPQECDFARHFNIFIMVMILLSCTVVVAETSYLVYAEGCEFCAPVPEGADAATIARRVSLEYACRPCQPDSDPIFNKIDAGITIVFAIEYLVRLLTAHESHHIRVDPPPSTLDPRQQRAWIALRRTRKFVLNPLNMIDAVALLPLPISLIAPGSFSSNLSALRALRFLRLFRVTKFGRFTEGLALFLRVIRDSSLAFSIFAVCYFFGAIVSSSAMYFVERGVWNSGTSYFMRRAPGQVAIPEPSPFTSIPGSMWWVAVTFAAVGYGDGIPASGWGYFLGTMAMYYGMFIVTMPISILGFYFATEFGREKISRQRRNRVDHFAARALHHILTPSAEFNKKMLLRRAWNTWLHEVRSASAPFLLGGSNTVDVRAVVHNELSAFVRACQMKLLVSPKVASPCFGLRQQHTQEKDTLSDLVRQEVREAVRRELTVLEELVMDGMRSLRADLEGMRLKRDE